MVSISRRQGTRYLWLIIGILAATASADIQATFIWGFMNPQSTSLPECASLQLFVNTSGTTTPAQPPFTMIAYEVGGIATRQLAGSNPNNLWWTVDHAAKTELVLSMVDSAGNSGGIAPQVYSVIPDPSTGTTCHPANTTTSVKLTTNSTNSLESCAVLQLKMSGGTKPYTVTIASIGAPFPTNDTLDSQSDTLFWVNRAVPGQPLIASVNDAQGTYATSTNLISTFGTKDLTCGNRVSTQNDSTGQSSGSQTSQSSSSSTSSGYTSNSSDSNSSGSGRSTSTPKLVGGILGSAAVIGAVIGMYFFLKRRKAATNRSAKYFLVDLNDAFGFPGIRRPNSTATEITPFVMTPGQDTPYTDTPQANMSLVSRVMSDGAPRSDMPSRPLTLLNSSSGASPFVKLENPSPMAFTPPPSSTASSFDIYGTNRRAPSSSFETSDSLIAGPLAGPAYAGAVVGSERGPSTAPLAFAQGADRDSGNGKRGPVPSQAAREGVYQHADILDIVELPPAYKERERTDL